MAYEVVKRVGNRAYRYRVESYRDPETKRSRSRWTYLGVASSAEVPGAPAKRAAPGQTRDRLLDAFGRLAKDQAFRDISAGAVAEAAGLAHGTFYRYFRGKADLLTAALDRVREAFARERPDFEPPYGDRSAERARIADWVRTLVEKPVEHAGVLRAYFDALETDTELRERHRARHEERVGALSRYLGALGELGIASIPRPEALAAALTVLIDGTVRSIVFEPSSLGPQAPSGIGDLFDRAIFLTEL